LNYGEIISEALRLTWRNRFLWFFGFFVAGAGSLNFPSSSGGASGGSASGDSNRLVSRLSGLGGTFSEHTAAILTGVIAAAFVAFLVFLVLSLLSRGALAESVAALHRGERRGFSAAWRAGAASFWRVLGQGLVLLLLSLAILVMLAVPSAAGVAATLFLTQSVGFRVLFIVLIVLLFLALLFAVFVPLSIVGQFALRELVVRRRPVISSIGGGFGLFRQNLGRSILVWLIGMGLSLGTGAGALAAFLLLGIVLVGPAVALGAAGYAIAAIVTGVIGGLLLLALILLISGAIGTFRHAYWTLAYLRLTALPVNPAPPEP
jgi:hypothetical protein